MHSLTWAAADSWVIFKRHAAGMARTPQVLFYSTVQPALFVLMFVTVFGGAVDTPGRNYAEFLVPGIFVQAITFSLAVTASSVALDIREGLFERLRTLPIARPSVLLGRSFADLGVHLVSVAAIALLGLVVGWRIHGGPADALAAFGLLALYAYAITWLGILIGLTVKAPQTASQAAMLWAVPTVFLSNLFVPPSTLPDWLEPIAAWNPLSSVIATVRDLFGNVGVAEAGGPGDFAPLYALLTAAAILLIVLPLAVRRYYRRNAGGDA